MNKKIVITLVIVLIIFSTLFLYFFYFKNIIELRNQVMQKNFLLHSYNDIANSVAKTLVNDRFFMQDSCNYKIDSDIIIKNITFNCSDFKLFINFSLSGTAPDEFFVFNNPPTNSTVDLIFDEFYDGQFFKQIGCTVSHRNYENYYNFSVYNCSMPVRYNLLLTLNGNEVRLYGQTSQFMSNSTIQLLRFLRRYAAYKISRYDNLISSLNPFTANYTVSITPTSTKIYLFADRYFAIARNSKTGRIIIDMQLEKVLP